MPYHKLSTAKIAKAVGCHPNTVRLYEQWGFLPAVPRSPAGYRLYTEAHLDQMRLARMGLNTDWPGRRLRTSVVDLIKQAALGDLGGALELAYQHLALVNAVQAQAESAAKLLVRWAQGAPTDATVRQMRMVDTARLLGLTRDILRNWERSGLIAVPRDPANGYRQYGQIQVARLRVIRMLRNAGYSTMAILRMLIQLDEGTTQDLRQALNTPRADEDVFYATDRWVSTLDDQEQRALKMITLLEERISKEQCG